MASAVKRSRTVALSAERVLQSLEQKGDGNDGMSSGEESDLYRQLQETGDIYRSRYKVFCVTVLLRKLAHNAFHFQIILLSSSGHSIYNSDINYSPRIGLSTLTETVFPYLERHFLFPRRRLLNFMRWTHAKKLNLFIYLFLWCLLCISSLSKFFNHSYFIFSLLAL